MEKKTIVITVLLLGIPLVLRAIQGAVSGTWAPIVPYPRIRVDSWGDGHFETSRVGHIHRGVDIEVFKGESVYAPFSGKINRVAYPYADDLRWTGLEMLGAVGSPWEGFRIKMFYMSPDMSLIGKDVAQGQPIGTAQGINEKYSTQMKNHIHIELWKGQQYLDPTANIFPNGEPA